MYDDWRGKRKRGTAAAETVGQKVKETGRRAGCHLCGRMGVKVSVPVETSKSSASLGPTLVLCCGLLLTELDVTGAVEKVVSSNGFNFEEWNPGDTEEAAALAVKVVEESGDLVSFNADRDSMKRGVSESKRKSFRARMSLLWASLSADPLWVESLAPSRWPLWSGRPPLALREKFSLSSDWSEGSTLCSTLGVVPGGGWKGGGW